MSNTVLPLKLVTGLLVTYRAPWTNTDSELFPYEGVVDLMGNVMEGFPVIRTSERERGQWVGYAAHVYCNMSDKSTHLR